jgi:hypothetical protein
MPYKIEYKQYIQRIDLQKNRDKIYVFGDNDQRSGFGGQAKEMRGEPNAIGIRVKKRPSLDSESFYTDGEHIQNTNKIDEDLQLLKTLAQNKTIIFPSNGIGTGLANLKISSPKTFNYLTLQLKQKFDIDNGLSK